ncbi:MAG: DNA repair protein RadA [Balneolales bacterium]|nr:DNA repair protein RadA [Balneolales bacterium]
MAKSKSRYECNSCGYITPRWLGNCPGCKSWNSFTEVKELPQESAKASAHRAKTAAGSAQIPEARKLAEVRLDETMRTTTGMAEFDRVLGGGLVGGSFILIGGDPGVGKSTLSLQLAGKRPDLKILYCSGEESAGQIRQRADRLGIVSDGLYIYTETDILGIQRTAEEINPDLLIIDSIQTVYRPEVSSMPGSVAQIRETAGLLMRMAKLNQLTTIVIGHVTKDGDLAGPRVLEHMVDVVLQFEGDKQLNYRLLRTLKNRFGRTHEVGVFEMNQAGLRDVENPSELFLSAFTEGISGNAAACILEGNRAIILEVQALVTPASYGTPQRTASGFDHRRLSLLIAVLEKRLGYRFGDKDVFLNVAGGIRLQDTASDLAVATALVSSFLDKAIPERTLLIGEIGLGAEVRPVNGLETRVREARKSGFKKIYIPDYQGKVSDAVKGTISVKQLPEINRALFGGRKG